ncbi:MAG: transcription antitermination protein NusB [Chthoniobacter sp.]|jgi:N utilization substance protein B|nr:transcription antitermination protein NusB [Chthoniobacter sp.]
MGKRREGREAAVQFLYQIDLNAGSTSSLYEAFWELRSGPDRKAATPHTRAFAEQLVEGVSAHAVEIDAQIKKFAANYELHRIAAVDRNILRVAIYEMLFCPDIAPVIAINEAIEIAKKFGTEKSGAFVNGILDRVQKELGRPPREGAPTPASSHQ